MTDERRCNQYMACLAAASSAFPIGIALGWTSPMKEWIRNGGFGFDVTLSDYGWIAAAFPLGAMFSCIPTGFIIDRLGRQSAMVLAILPQLAAWLLIVNAFNVWFLYGARFLLGMVCGLLYVTIPVYTVEIAQKEVRGSMGMLFMVLADAGILFVYVFGSFMDAKSLNLLSFVMPMIIASLPMFVPKSPAYLLRIGNEKAATKSLKQLRGSSQDLEAELTEMNNDIHGQRTFAESMKDGVVVKALFISCVLYAFQALAGNLSLIFFHTGLMVKADFDDLRPVHGTIVFGAVQFLSKLIFVFIVEKMGRRRWLMISTFAVALSHVILAVYLISRPMEEDWVLGRDFMALFSTCFFVVMYASGLSTIPMVLNGQIFPTEVKGSAGSIPAMIFWLLNSVVVTLFVTFEIHDILGILFISHAGMCLLAFLFVIFFVPETRGKTYNEIAENIDQLRLKKK